MVISFKYEDLYNVDKDGNLTFNFGAYSIPQSETGCKFILQNNYLRKNFMYILRDFNSENNFFYLSFKAVRDGEFKKIGVFLTFILVLLIILAVLLTLFIFWNCYKRLKNSSSENVDEEYQKVDA